MQIFQYEQLVQFTSSTPINGTLLDDIGIVSDMASCKTDIAKSVLMPSIIFSFRLAVDEDGEKKPSNATNVIKIVGMTILTM